MTWSPMQPGRMPESSAAARTPRDNPLLAGSLMGLASRMLENKLLPALRGLPQ